MATGDMDISDRKARSIELALKLPEGWLDRDNIALLRMASSEYELHKILAGYPDDTRVALRSFLSAPKR
jgi:hypothetical protein